MSASTQAPGGMIFLPMAIASIGASGSSVCSNDTWLTVPAASTAAATVPARAAMVRPATGARAVLSRSTATRRAAGRASDRPRNGARKPEKW